MTVSPDPAAARGRVRVDRLSAVRTLSEQMPRFMRLVHALKAQIASQTTGTARPSCCSSRSSRLGPLRQSALAELVHADPSTVSRHVAALVEQGLVRRVADESDGRASRLRRHRRRATPPWRRCGREREAHLEQVTADWSDADLATFTTLFGRLLDDLAAALPGLRTPGADPSTPPTAREIR